ncbi:MAG: hypothetical protein M0Z99_19705, partial [Betaproteobacteria bacterium]|nr:hypothetical protein [Betaproteobacteria bacterium]
LAQYVSRVCAKAVQRFYFKELARFWLAQYTRCAQLQCMDGMAWRKLVRYLMARLYAHLGRSAPKLTGH